MSTEGETLQGSVLPYRCSVCPPFVTRQMSNLANSKTQNAFLFPVHAMFRHDCPLAVKPASTPPRLVHTHKLGEILYLLICSFLLCLPWLLRSRVRKFRRDYELPCIYTRVCVCVCVCVCLSVRPFVRSTLFLETAHRKSRILSTKKNPFER